LLSTRAEREVAFALEQKGLAPHEIPRRCSEVFSTVGLEGLEDAPSDRLSRGEQQRLALAATLATQPRLLLLDEPVASLDPAARKHLLFVLQQLREEWGLTIIVAEQRPSELFPLADHIIWLDRGSIRFQGSP